MKKTILSCYAKTYCIYSDENYLAIDFEVKRIAVGKNQSADGFQRPLVKISPFSSFNKYKSASKNGKEIENIENAHVACLMYILNKSS